MGEVLLANAGNTFTSVGFWTGESVTRVTCIRTGVLLQNPDRICAAVGADGESVWVMACCVLPEAQNALRERFGQRILFLCSRMVNAVDFSGVDTETLGQDRIANVAAANALYEPPVMIVDCGTAITTEVIDAQRRFRGGVIAPGRGLQRWALEQGTGQLPNISCEHVSDTVTATCTVDAIAGGVDEGMTAAVGHWIAAVQKELNMVCPAVATGRDARFFCDRVRELEAAPPDFTLYGLGIAARSQFGGMNCC